MRVLILGAGHTGDAVAQALVGESNDITVVDIEQSRVLQLQRHFDLRGIVGDAASPAVLREAGIEDADIVIAVTASDETNLVACLLASELFNVPTRIARVRRNELSNYPDLLGDAGFHITSTIWPEKALTDALLRLIEFPQALQVIDLAQGTLYLMTIDVGQESPCIGQTGEQLRTVLDKHKAAFVAAFHENKVLAPDATLAAGDDVLVLVNHEAADSLISYIHPKENRHKNLVIAGDADMALRIVAGLKNRNAYNIKILEQDEQKARDIAEQLPEQILLVKGSYLQQEDLTNVDIDTCDLFISLSKHDDGNIMSALLAKRLGAKRSIALVDNQTFADLVRDTSIDIIISKTRVTLSELMQYVRRGDVVAVHGVHDAASEVLEIIAHGTPGSSRVIGQPISSITLPKGSSVCALVRGTDFLAASPDLVIEPEDRVIVFSADKHLMSKIEALFAVDVGFF